MPKKRWSKRTRQEFESVFGVPPSRYAELVPEDDSDFYRWLYAEIRRRDRAQKRKKQAEYRLKSLRERKQLRFVTATVTYKYEGRQWKTLRTAFKIIIPTDREMDYVKDYIERKLSNVYRLENVDYKRIEIMSPQRARMKQLREIPLYGTQLGYKLLGDITDMNPTEDRCVEDFIWYNIRKVQKNKGRLMKWTREAVRSYHCHEG